MRLTDLDPSWVGAGGDGISRGGMPVPERRGVGVTFRCPCGACNTLCYVPFSNPLDGGEPHEPSGDHWTREGDAYETLTLRPSILRAREKGGCGWHGFVTAGEVTSA